MLYNNKQTYGPRLSAMGPNSTQIHRATISPNEVTEKRKGKEKTAAN